MSFTVFETYTASPFWLAGTPLRVDRGQASDGTPTVRFTIGEVSTEIEEVGDCDDLIDWLDGSDFRKQFA